VGGEEGPAAALAVTVAGATVGSAIDTSCFC
jgi:hypothetical protein